MSIRIHEATGAGAINELIDPGCAFKILNIYLHLDAVGGAVEDFTVDIDSGKSVAHNVRLIAEAMAAASDLALASENYVRPNGDKIQIDYANSNAKTWGLTVLWTEAL